MRKDVKIDVRKDENSNIKKIGRSNLCKYKILLECQILTIMKIE